MIGTEIFGQGGWVMIQKAPWSNLRLVKYIFFKLLIEKIQLDAF